MVCMAAVSIAPTGSFGGGGLVLLLVDRVGSDTHSTFVMRRNLMVRSSCADHSFWFANRG